MEQEKLLSDRLFEEKEIEKALVEKNLKLEDEIKSCEANVSKQYELRSDLENRLKDINKSTESIISRVKSSMLSKLNDFNKTIQNLMSKNSSLENNLNIFSR